MSPFNQLKFRTVVRAGSAHAPSHQKRPGCIAGTWRLATLPLSACNNRAASALARNSRRLLVTAHDIGALVGAGLPLVAAKMESGGLNPTGHYDQSGGEKV